MTLKSDSRFVNGSHNNIINFWIFTGTQGETKQESSLHWRAKFYSVRSD